MKPLRLARCALSILAILGVSCSHAAAGRTPRVEQPSPVICKLHVRKIHTFWKPLLLLSQEQAFADHFPEIQQSLELRQYDRAANLMKRFFNYTDAESTSAYVFGDYVNRGHFRESFIVAYQGQFCSNVGYLPPSANIWELPFWLAQSLRSAIDGDYVESQRLSLVSFQDGTWIGFPLLLAGVLDVLLKRPLDARREWISVFYVPEQVYPEQIGPSGDAVQAAEFLLHFRP